MDPMTIAALTSLAPMLVDIGVGAWQQGQSKKYDTPRPTMPIPESATKQLGLANSLAGMTETPWSDKLVENIYGTQAGIINQAKNYASSSSDVLGMLGGLQQGTNEALSDVGASNQAFYLGNQANLMNSLGNMANWENTQWMWDEKAKYLEDAATRSALLNAAIRNMSGGAKGAAGVGYELNKMDMSTALDMQSQGR